MLALGALAVALLVLFPFTMAAVATPTLVQRTAYPGLDGEVAVLADQVADTASVRIVYSLAAWPFPVTGDGVEIGTSFGSFDARPEWTDARHVRICGGFRDPGVVTLSLAGADSGETHVTVARGGCPSGQEARP